MKQYNLTDKYIHIILYDENLNVCICKHCVSPDFHVFILFPLHSRLPPRITQRICKNTLLISRQRWQPLPMTSAPCTPPPPFSFSFFISCSAPETQILSHRLPSVIQTLFPPTSMATLTCHTDSQRRNMDSDTY